MKLPVVQWLMIAAALVGAGPPAAEPEPDPGGPVIGIAWHRQATVAPAIQQRLVAAIGARSVDAQIVDAIAVARSSVASEVSAQRAEALRGWQSQLGDAAASFRAGQLAEVDVQLDTLLDAIAADPVVPGAAAIAWQVQVLRGQVAWSRGDDQAQHAALSAAIALDPTAFPSTREVPPAFVETYRHVHAQVDSERDTWGLPQLELPDAVPFAVEIDGMPGLRPVPPGPHFVVVRRLGIPPVGRVVAHDERWSVPSAAVVVPDSLPPDADAAEQLCDLGALDTLVLARQRGERLGLQQYWCGHGFARPWYEQRAGWQPGVANVRINAPETPADGSFVAVLHLDERWPELRPERSRRTASRWIASDGGPILRPRDRVRRALPWLLLSGVVAGSITLGVLLGTDPTPDLRIDGDDFLGR